MSKETKQQPKCKNFVAKRLHDGEFRNRIVEEKRRHKLDVLHEHDADEDLFEFFGLGKAPKE